MAEEALKLLLEKFENNINTKLENIEKNITTNINNNIDLKFSSFQQELEILKTGNAEQEKRLDFLEKQSRQRNLVLFGVAEEESSYCELEQIVLDIINFKLEISCDGLELEFVRRMGKKDKSKIRPICFGLTTLGKKITLLKNKKKLEDTSTYLKEDYPPKILQIRKELQEKCKEERDKGNKVTIKYDQLVIVKDTGKSTQKDEIATRNKNKRPLEYSPPATSTINNSKSQTPENQLNKNKSIPPATKKNKPGSPSVSNFLRSGNTHNNNNPKNTRQDTTGNSQNKT